MKSTDIPNGYVVVGPRGVPILVEFNKDGKAEPKGLEVSITGWSDIKQGKLPDGILVLVHSVVGENQMLVKHLRAYRLMIRERGATVAEIARLGKLSVMAEKMRGEYLAKLEAKEKAGCQAATPSE